LDFAQLGGQRPVCARNIRPHPEAYFLFAGSLVRVNQVAIILVVDVGPNVVQQHLHGYYPTAFDQKPDIGDAANRECDAEHTSQGFVAAAAVKKAPTICGQGS
jgi:hypothetical protein